MELWHLILQESVTGGSNRIEELIGTMSVAVHDRAALFQTTAYIVMTYDPARAVLLQRYALEQYRAQGQWIDLIACAHEALFFPALRLLALAALLDAALIQEDEERITKYGALACQQHAQGLLTRGQLCSLFFNALVPYYHKQLKTKYLVLLRRALQMYKQEYSDLVYTYLQANLYSYTSDAAQQLVGQCDVLARR